MIRASDKRPRCSSVSRTELSSRKHLVISRRVYSVDTSRCNFTLRGEKLYTAVLPVRLSTPEPVANPAPHTPVRLIRVVRTWVHPSIHSRRFHSSCNACDSRCPCTHPDFYRAVFVQGGLSHEQKVRLSVRLSVKHVNCDRRRETSASILKP